VLGDLTEQGRYEKEEHERLANVLMQTDLRRVVLVGPRMRSFVQPLLDKSEKIIESFIGPKEALDYLNSALDGEEILIFKGARFLEGIIEHLLFDSADVSKLCRREKIWQERRKKWGV